MTLQMLLADLFKAEKGMNKIDELLKTSKDKEKLLSLKKKLKNKIIDLHIQITKKEIYD